MAKAEGGTSSCWAMCGSQARKKRWSERRARACGRVVPGGRGVVWERVAVVLRTRRVGFKGEYYCVCGWVGERVRRGLQDVILAVGGWVERLLRVDCFGIWFFSF